MTYPSNKFVDQFANVTKETMEDKGSAVVVTFHSDMEPNNSAGSRTADFTPQDIYENNATVNTDFYKDGVNLLPLAA